MLSLLISSVKACLDPAWHFPLALPPVLYPTLSLSEAPRMECSSRAHHKCTSFPFNLLECLYVMNFKQFTKGQMRLSPVKSTLPRDYPQPNSFPNTAILTPLVLGHSTLDCFFIRLVILVSTYSPLKTWIRLEVSTLDGVSQSSPFEPPISANSSSEFCMFYIIHV